MIFNSTMRNEKRVAQSVAKGDVMTKPHKWFAWYPVRVGVWEWCWLQTVERQYENHYSSPFGKRYTNPTYQVL